MKPFGPRAKLTSLTPAQTEQVVSWMLDECLTLRETAKRIQEAFGFSVSIHTVSKFWYRECVPRKLLRSAEVADSVQAAAARLKNGWQGANSQLIGQRIFEALADPATDLKTVCALGSVLEKIEIRGLHAKALRTKTTAEKRRFEQKERQIGLDREKFEFDAVETVLKQAERVRTISSDGSLSSGEKREQLRRLLFPQTFETSPT